MIKKKITKIRTKIYTYTAEIEPGEDGYLVVSVPALPGCFTQGRTYEEAVEMARDAIRCYLGALIKRGEPIPQEDKSSKRVAVSIGIRSRIKAAA